MLRLMSEDLPSALERRLKKYIGELETYPWFSTAGKPVRSRTRASNMSEACFGWWPPKHPDQGGNRHIQWSSATHALELRVQQMLTESQIDAVFQRVSERLGPSTWAALGEYLTRVDSDGTAPDPTGAHSAAAIDAHPAILRDLCWASIETLLREDGFFRALLPWYRKGRWPCGWSGEPGIGNPVLL